MKNRRTLAAVGIASAMALTSALTPVLAAETKATPTPQQTASPADQATEILRTSQDVVSALQDVRAARVALFNGSPDEAKTLLAGITQDLDAAKTSSADIAIAPQKADAKDQYLPFDVQMSLAEDFKPTDDKVATLKEAQQHMQKGDQKRAAKVLSDAAIDVTVSAALLPIDATSKNATEATKLMDEGKYYEANLALKSIEDSVLVESYALSGIPTQGNAG